MSEKANKVFISYSRENQYYANSLRRDLNRAGLEAWRDSEDIPHDSPSWESEIRDAIVNCDYFELLGSPESTKSENVKKEYDLAVSADKSILLLAVAPFHHEHWRVRQVDVHAQHTYWGSLRRLCTGWGKPDIVPHSLSAMLQSKSVYTVSDAAKELQYEACLFVDGMQFCQLPLNPSGYCMSWLFAPADSPLIMPSCVAIAMNFTGNATTERYTQMLHHWVSQAASVRVKDAWLVMLEGRVNRKAQPMRYEVQAKEIHQWTDAIAAGKQLVGEYGNTPMVGYYLNCLLPLAFEVGMQSTMRSEKRRVYHFDVQTPGYVIAKDGWTPN